MPSINFWMPPRVFFDRDQRIVVVFFARHRKQVVGVAQIGIDFGEREDDRFQRFLFLAQVLGALLVVPDGGVF